MAPTSEQVPHLLHVFSTFAVGGPQMRFVALANALGKKFRHTILAMDGNIAAGVGLGPQADFRYATIPVIKGSGISFGNVRSARHLIRELQPDLLLTYNWGTIEWAISDWGDRMCPHIHVEDGFGPGESPSKQNRLRVLARRFLLRPCAAVVVPSKTLFNLAINVWRLPPQKVIYLPNGIEIRRSERAPDSSLVQQYRLAPNQAVIGTVAALRPEKNLLRLLRIFAQLPPSLNL